MNYWINTVSRDHAMTGLAAGFTQANHGRPHNLRRMQRNDLVVIYSPKTKIHDGESLQCFTALGRVLDDEPYQIEMRPDFHPFRRKVTFFDCHAAPIRPLINNLDFIVDKKRWGFPFRKGLFTIGRSDFMKIAKAMNIDVGQFDANLEQDEW
jgi:hypothetical protein